MHPTTKRAQKLVSVSVFVLSLCLFLPQEGISSKNKEAAEVGADQIAVSREAAIRDATSRGEREYVYITKGVPAIGVR